MLETRRGAIVTLGQIATSTTPTKPWRVDRVNGVRGMRVACASNRQANTVEVSRRVLEEIEAVNRDFPQIAVIPVINQGNFIERSIQNVARSVLYGGGLAVSSSSSSSAISAARWSSRCPIPISIIATFALLYFGGFTINLMTLGGLALGVGMMVDSSIVVLENIFRKRDEEHEEPALAAAEGAQEVASAIVASTITTLVIFLPVVFVQGVSGMLFSALAFVIVFALVCSLLVSLSLVPMLLPLMLAKGEMQKRRSPRVQRLVDWSDRMFDGSIRPIGECCGGSAAPLAHGGGRGGGVRPQPHPHAPAGERVPAAQRRGRGADPRGDGGGDALRDRGRG
jgi:hydrophobic/amphiphilic exporter-1 (mainly G- bacteria), HAE1 family